MHRQLRALTALLMLAIFGSSLSAAAPVPKLRQFAGLAGSSVESSAPAGAPSAGQSLPKRVKIRQSTPELRLLAPERERSSFWKIDQFLASLTGSLTPPPALPPDWRVSPVVLRPHPIGPLGNRDPPALA